MKNKDTVYPSDFATIRNGTVVERWKKFSSGIERVMVRNWPTKEEARRHAAELNRLNKRNLYW